MFRETATARHLQHILNILMTCSIRCAATAHRHAWRMNAMALVAGSYAGEVADLQDVQDAVSQLDTTLRSSETKAAGFSTSFQKFSALWKSDLPAALQVGHARATMP